MSPFAPLFRARFKFMSFISSAYNYFFPSAPAENANTASGSAEAVVHQASRAALDGLGSSRTMPVASNGLRYASWADAVKGAPVADESTKSVAPLADQPQ